MTASRPRHTCGSDSVRCLSYCQVRSHHDRQRAVRAAALPVSSAAQPTDPSTTGAEVQPAGAAGAAGGAGGPSVAASPRTGDLGLEPFRALVEGRRFMCTMCGKCCTGEGEIWVNHDEAARIAKHLNLSLQRFLDTYTKQYSKYEGWRMLRTHETSSACIFLGADNKCAIHTVRPSQCSTYPWWPELMNDREWDWEKREVCEGFDHPEAGPLDVDEAARQLREANKMTQLRLLASKVRVVPQVAHWANDVLIWDEEDAGGSLPMAETPLPPQTPPPKQKPGGRAKGGRGGAASREMGAGSQGRGPKSSGRPSQLS